MNMSKKSILRRTLLSGGAFLWGCMMLPAAIVLAEEPPQKTASIPPLDRKEVKQISDRVALDFMKGWGQLHPESASFLGVEGTESLVTRFADLAARDFSFLQGWLEKIQAMETVSHHPDVLADLALLKSRVKAHHHHLEVIEEYKVIPCISAGRFVYLSLQGLADRLSAEKAGGAMAERLKKYVHGEGQHPPLVESIERQTMALIKKYGSKGVYPWKEEIAHMIQENEKYLEDMTSLLAQTKNKESYSDLNILAEQLRTHGKFLAQELLPHGRAHPALPREVYKSFLLLNGVERDPKVLDLDAQETYSAALKSFRFLTERLANRHKITPKEVEAFLSKKQDKPWQETSVQALNRSIKLVAQKGIAPSLRESASMRLANTSEEQLLELPKIRALYFNRKNNPLEFLVPHRMTEQGEAAMVAEIIQKLYPGEGWFHFAMHEESNLLRTPYIFYNGKGSGWALYMGHIMAPHMTEEEQFFLLQSRVLKAANVMLEAQLYLNRISTEKAVEILVEEVGLSLEQAKKEVYRYVGGTPGAAAADYARYQDILDLRETMKKRLLLAFKEPTFNKKLARAGLLPVKQIEKSMMRDLKGIEGKIQVAPTH